VQTAYVKASLNPSPPTAPAVQRQPPVLQVGLPEQSRAVDPTARITRTLGPEFTGATLTIAEVASTVPTLDRRP
jgi:hypothetical protein